MTKDVDIMRDTGGTYKHKDLQKPSRSDRKNHGLSEKDPDSKDTRRDPDMKLSSIAYKIATKFRYLYEDQDVIFIGFKENKSNYKKSIVYEVYSNGYISEYKLDGTDEKTYGSHLSQLKTVLKLPEVVGWDDSDEDAEIYPPIFGDENQKNNKIKKLLNDFKQTNHSLNDHKGRRNIMKFLDISDEEDVLFVGFKYFNESRKTDPRIYVIDEYGICTIYSLDNNKITTMFPSLNTLNKIYSFPEYIGWKDEPILRTNHGQTPPQYLIQLINFYEKQGWTETHKVDDALDLLTKYFMHEISLFDFDKSIAKKQGKIKDIIVNSINQRKNPIQELQKYFKRTKTEVDNIRKKKDQLVKISNYKIAKQLIKLAKSLIS